MKNILFLSLLFFTFNMYSQSIPEAELTQEGLVLPRYTKADKAMLPQTQARVVFNMTDQSMAYHTGSGWDRVASENRVLELIDQRFQPYVSLTGDRLYLSPGQFVVIPGISAAQSVVSDIDGNVYQTTTINGEQWMAENLKTTRYSNGDPIPDGTTAININPTDDYLFYFDDNPVYKNIYGLLYTHAVADDPRNVCPTGWHTPFKVEWEALEAFMASDGWAGQEAKAMKAQFANWKDSPPFYIPADHYGMAVLPAPYYNSVNGLDKNARFWLYNSGVINSNGWAVLFDWFDDTTTITDTGKSQGFSIRCKKD